MPNSTHTNIVIIIVSLFPFFASAQFATPQGGGIWGNSNSSNTILGPSLQEDASWGTLPSQQTANATVAGNNFLRSSNTTRRRTYRNGSGQPLLMDSQGNVMYDVSGNPLIDSLAMNQQTPSAYLAVDPSVPQPVDPVDVPIDGGVGILLAIGLVSGYKKMSPKKQLAFVKIK